MLNGKPIKDHDFLTRAYNMFSPIQLNLDPSPGRHMLFNSGYDLRLSTYSAPDGTDLSDEPRLRSAFQKAIGDQNLERRLDKLAQDPRIQASIEEMHKDIRDGNRGAYESKDYYHNKVLKRMFDDARKRAWAMVRLQPNAAKIIQSQKQADLLRLRKLRESSNPKQEFDLSLIHI